MKIYIKDLKTETEAVKMCMKERLYLLKTSINQTNANESAENAKMIQLLQQQNQNLVEENASKNTIIKILAENQISDNPKSKSTAFKKFTKVDNKFRQKRSQQRKHKKIDLNCSNRYEILCITDSNAEDKSEKPDNARTKDVSTTETIQNLDVQIESTNGKIILERLTKQKLQNL